jgi:predicted protein tyrosine phosphatase
MKTEKKPDGKNILFICSANKNRSITAQFWFSLRHPANNYDSAGSSKFATSKYKGKYFNQKQLECADRIICMEKRNYNDIQKIFGTNFNSKIEIANISDNYKFLEIGLIWELTDKIKF